jgi:hypothetical protein
VKLRPQPSEIQQKFDFCVKYVLMHILRRIDSAVTQAAGELLVFTSAMSIGELNFGVHEQRRS